MSCATCNKGTFIPTLEIVPPSAIDMITSDEWVLVQYLGQHTNTTLLSSNSKTLINHTGNETYGFVKRDVVLYVLKVDVPTHPLLQEVEVDFENPQHEKYFLKLGVNEEIYQMILNPNEEEGIVEEVAEVLVEIDDVVEEVETVLDIEINIEESAEVFDEEGVESTEEHLDVETEFPTLAIREDGAIAMSQYAKDIGKHHRTFASMVNKENSPYLTVTNDEGKVLVYDIAS